MTDSPFWNDDWMKVQQKYWDNWTEMSRKAIGLDKPPKSPWENAMDHWWQAVSPSVPDTGADFMRRMMDQGKQFFRMSEEFSKNYQSSNDWLEAVNKTFSELHGLFANSLQNATAMAGNPNDESLRKLMAFWETPLDNWQHMTHSLSMMPDDLLRNLPRGEQLDKLFNMPGLGYNREEEGKYKELMQKAMAYQSAMSEYIKFFSSLGMVSVERLGKKVEQLIKDEKSIDSARGLYDLWVATCEEVYGEQVMTSEYAKTHGDLVNALMAYKHKMGEIVDDNLGAMSMPTRRELRTLQTRLQESRRETKALKSEVETLKAQMQALDERLAQAPAAPPATAQDTPKPVRKKATTRRTTTARKPANTSTES